MSDPSVPQPASAWGRGGLQFHSGSVALSQQATTGQQPMQHQATFAPAGGSWRGGAPAVAPNAQGVANSRWSSTSGAPKSDSHGPSSESVVGDSDEASSRTWFDSHRKEAASTSAGGASSAAWRTRTSEKSDAEASSLHAISVAPTASSAANAAHSATKQSAAHAHAPTNANNTNNANNDTVYQPSDFGNATLPGAQWFYLDPSSLTQGPFSSDDMRVWYDSNYFDLKLPIQCLEPGQTPDASTKFTELGVWFLHGNKAFLLHLPDMVEHRKQAGGQQQVGADGVGSKAGSSSVLASSASSDRQHALSPVDESSSYAASVHQLVADDEENINDVTILERYDSNQPSANGAAQQQQAGGLNPTAQPWNQRAGPPAPNANWQQQASSQSQQAVSGSRGPSGASPSGPQAWSAPSVQQAQAQSLAQSQSSAHTTPPLHAQQSPALGQQPNSLSLQLQQQQQRLALQLQALPTLNAQYNQLQPLTIQTFLQAFNLTQQHVANLTQQQLQALHAQFVQTNAQRYAQQQQVQRQIQQLLMAQQQLQQAQAQQQQQQQAQANPLAYQQQQQQQQQQFLLQQQQQKLQQQNPYQQQQQAGGQQAFAQQGQFGAQQAYGQQYGQPQQSQAQQRYGQLDSTRPPSTAQSQSQQASWTGVPQGGYGGVATGGLDQQFGSMAINQQQMHQQAYDAQVQQQMHQQQQQQQLSQQQQQSAADMSQTIVYTPNQVNTATDGFPTAAAHHQHHQPHPTQQQQQQPQAQQTQPPAPTAVAVAAPQPTPAYEEPTPTSQVEEADQEAEEAAADQDAEESHQTQQQEEEAPAHENGVDEAQQQQPEEEESTGDASSQSQQQQQGGQSAAPSVAPWAAKKAVVEPAKVMSLMEIQAEEQRAQKAKDLSAKEKAAQAARRMPFNTTWGGQAQGLSLTPDEHSTATVIHANNGGGNALLPTPIASVTPSIKLLTPILSTVKQAHGGRMQTGKNGRRTEPAIVQMDQPSEPTGVSPVATTPAWGTTPAATTTTATPAATAAPTKSAAAPAPVVNAWAKRAPAPAAAASSSSTAALLPSPTQSSTPQQTVTMLNPPLLTIRPKSMQNLDGSAATGPVTKPLNTVRILETTTLEMAPHQARKSGSSRAGGVSSRTGGSVRKPAASASTASASEEAGASAAAAAAATTTAFGGPTMSADFETWCLDHLTKLAGADGYDVSLPQFLMTVQSDEEARGYMHEYLGTSAAADEFADEFLRLRAFETTLTPTKETLNKADHADADHEAKDQKRRRKRGGNQEF